MGLQDVRAGSPQGFGDPQDGLTRAAGWQPRAGSPQELRAGSPQGF